MIELKNISKTYGKGEKAVTAIKEVNITINDGEIFGIIGLSGAGKSTLVRCINFLERPTTGDVVIDGKNLGQLSTKELLEARRNIGMIFQGFNLLEQRTVLKNVCFPLEIAGVKKADAEKRARELLQLVSLAEKEKSYPSQLSGGQKQRVAFARALAPNPNLLLLDEPFAAIDAKVRQELRSWLKDMIERLGVTSIFVTHDQSEAIEVADEIIITNKGRIEQIGSPIDIYQHPQTAFSASFFGQTTTLDDYTKFKTFDVVDNVDRAVIRPEFVKVTKLSETTAQKASVSVGEVIKTSFRGDNIEIAVKCDGGTVYAYRGLDETPITVGEKVNVFLYRLFITKGDEVQILRNKSLQEESVII